jgi:hypothetical protein
MSFDSIVTTLFAMALATLLIWALFHPREAKAWAFGWLLKFC